MSDHGGVRDLLTVRTCCQATVLGRETKLSDPAAWLIVTESGTQLVQIDL
jgi:hypothetical protein